MYDISTGQARVGQCRAVAPSGGPSIRVPVIVGRGGKARPHHFEGMVRLAESIPGAQLVTLEDCHHVAHTAAPGQFVDELITPTLNRARW